VERLFYYADIKILFPLFRVGVLWSNVKIGSTGLYTGTARAKRAHVWGRTRMGENACGREGVWERTRVGENACERERVWERTRVGENACEREGV
jgi:hypothetical protein